MYQTGLRPEAPTSQTLDAGPIAILPQRFDPRLAEAIDAVPPDHLPELQVVGSMQAVAESIARQLARCGIEHAWLKDWLAQNIVFQASLFSQLTRAKVLDLRLAADTTADDTRFHTDRVRYRLFCTYRGPGIEWIDPKAASDRAGMPLDPTRILRMERGAIAFVRGDKGATPDRPALLHRCPKIDGSGTPRLLLTINEGET